MKNVCKDIHSPEKINSLKLDHLRKYEDIVQKLPNFPQSMPNLQLLSITTSVSTTMQWPRHPSMDLPGLFPSTLTHLTLHDWEFMYPLGTLLDVIEKNPSLELLDLRIHFKSPHLRKSVHQAPMGIKVHNPKLKSLKVYSKNVEDIGALISAIPLGEGVDVRITSGDKDAHFGTILLEIETTHGNLLLPSSMHYHHGDHLVLFRPNGKLFLISDKNLYPVNPLLFEAVKMIPGMCILSKGIESLHLDMMNHPGVFDPSLFPALRNLVIEEDNEPQHTLSKLFLYPEFCPKLQTIIFLRCDLQEGFMNDLTQFASKRKSLLLQLDHIAIIHEEDIFQNSALIPKLKGHVLTDVWVDKGLPNYLQI